MYRFGHNHCEFYLLGTCWQIECAATRVPCPASSPPGGGLSFAGRRAALGPAPVATVSLAIFFARFRGTAPTNCQVQQFAATAAEASAPVAAFAFSSLRLRLRFGSPCGGRRRAAGTSSGRHHARAAERFLPIRRHHPASSCCAAADHASSFSAVGYCQGRASVRFVPVARSSFAALGCGSTLAAVGADAGHRPSIHRTHAPKHGRQARASPGPRGRRHVLTRGHSLRSCPLCAPIPPAPLFP